MSVFSTIIVFLVFSVQYSFCFSRGEVVGKLLYDILRGERSPAILSARVCWTKSEQISFIKELPYMIQFMETTAHLNQINADQTNKIYYFADMGCSDSQQFIVSVDGRFFGHPYRWILLNENAKNLPSLPFLPDSNVILANAIENGFDLTQVYKIEKQHEHLILEPYGRWDYERGIEDFRTSKVSSERRRNLMGKRFTSSLVLLHNDSINHLDDYRDAHKDALTKSAHLVTKRLLETVNASVEHKYVQPQWGFKDPKTGMYNGMIGDLQRNKIEIGGSVLYMVPDRVPLLDYVTMTTPTRAHFVFRAPPLSYVSNIYGLPFSGIVWICTACLVLFATVVLYISYRFGPSLMTDCRSISDFMLVAIGTVCQMGTQISPKIISGRISLFFFCIATVFIYTSYTANIVALLQSTTKSINTIDDMLHSSLDYGIDDTPYSRYWFANAIEPTRKAFYKEKIEGKSKFVNLSYGIENMRKGLYAMHMEVKIGYKQIKDTFLEHEKCGLVEIPFIEQIDPWWAIQKHSPYKEIIKTNLFRIREMGIQSRENAQLYTDKPTCGSKGQNFGSVRLIDCYAVWLVLGYGCAISLIILFFEFITRKKMHCFRREDEQRITT